MTRLPDEFIAMLADMGPEYAGLADALTGAPASAAIRLNAGKPSAPPADATPVPWCAGGYLLPERWKFTFDPALHQGLYYVQDSSSMAHGEAVAAAVAAISEVADRPLRYLDACAAPGGKTICAIDRLPADAFVVANEYDQRRAAVLVENLAKHGSGRAVVTRGDASAINGPDAFFDIIAADVPCSGEGMMRKEEAAAAQWSAGLVASCAALQQQIVDNLWRMLRPGGCLIYSTCTFNRSENEAVVQHIVEDLGGRALPIAGLERPEIVRAYQADFPAYRFLPGRVDGEGQFIALIQKPAEDDANERPHRTAKACKSAKNNKPTKPGVDIGSLLDGDRVLDPAEAEPTAVLRSHLADLATVRSTFHVIAAGLPVGIVKGRDFVPSQQLALARDLRPDAFPRADVDRATALDYLRRQAIALPDGTPRGIVLLHYGGYPLGFVKNLGNRANNLYPAPWRILSAHE